MEIELTTATAQQLADIRTALAVMPIAGGTFTGNVTLGEEVAILMDPAIGADHKWSAIKAVTSTCGEAIALGQVVSQHTDGKWYKADANTTAGSSGDARRRLGIVLVGGAGNAPCTVMLNGVIRDASFGDMAAKVGAAVYVSEYPATTNGITVPAAGAAPFTTAGAVVRIIGHVSAQYEIDFNPDGVWSVIAA